jgi:hypothetical protein
MLNVPLTASDFQAHITPVVGSQVLRHPLRTFVLLLILAACVLLVMFFLCYCWWWRYYRYDYGVVILP